MDAYLHLVRASMLTHYVSWIPSFPLFWFLVFIVVSMICFIFDFKLYTTHSARAILLVRESMLKCERAVSFDTLFWRCLTTGSFPTFTDCLQLFTNSAISISLSTIAVAGDISWCIIFLEEIGEQTSPKLRSPPSLTWFF